MLPSMINYYNNRKSLFYRLSAILFSKEDAESVLRFEAIGTYLLYRDHESDRMYLSVR